MSKIEWHDVKKEPVPKDGKEYLLYTKTGIVSGWFDQGRWEESYDVREYTGSAFICYDDKFEIEVEETPDGDYSEVLAWAEIIKPDFI
jgi:hypothetical protein